MKLSIRYSRLRGFSLALLGALAFLYLVSGHISALSGNEFVAGRIIDDAVFFNPNTMNTGDIQAVLNAKVPVCDTNGTQPKTAGSSQTRAQWAAANNQPQPPYICLKDYSQSIQGSSVDAYCGGRIGADTKSAAQIIYDVSQACGVNPKVLIVLLQKEQSLVTDDWPWPIQYRSATGYGCPDTAPCDEQYYGFFNQVYNAARQFQRYVKQSSLFDFVSGQTANIQYNPNASCGSSSVFLQNQATAGLYNYTPYQPNATALSNIYGSQTDGCSAYGNRNFWRLYIDWFGSPLSTVAYAWLFEGQAAHSDASRTKAFTSVATVASGGKIYARVKARNMGTETWNQSTIRLGTSRPMDRASPFADSSWLSPTRPAQLLEPSIPPGQIGTFEFALSAPNTHGTYNEYFNLLAEGTTWMNDLGLFFTVNVNNSIPPPNSTATTLNSGEALYMDDYLLSPDAQSLLTFQRDGNVALYANFNLVWETGTFGTNTDRVVMQPDGNLVVYNQAGQALWSSNTQGNPGAHLRMQTDGNVVIYSSSNVALWSTAIIHNPDHLSYVNTTLAPGLGNFARLYPGQSIDTADRKFHLILQRDGNLVLYSPTRALWATGTDGKSPALLALQPDGNLVLYDRNAHPVWYSRTEGNGLLRLVVQQDGNLVLYNRLNTPYWNTGTAGAL